jgi:hypothetical protein
MSEILNRILVLAAHGEVRMSDHGYEETMNKRRHTKIVREGQYVAEVDVELIDTGNGWSPYLSLEDAYKLDDVRAALRRGDINTAARLARVFTLIPVTT